jgi:hypothetical protein
VTAAAYTVTVSPDLTSFPQGGIVDIIVTGTVTPALGATSYATITVSNPSSVVVGLASAAVNSASGIFTYSFYAGGNSNWVNGTYTITAVWEASVSGPAYTGTATFSYGTIAATTTSTTTSSTSTTTPPSVTTIIQVNNYTTTKVTTTQMTTTIAQTTTVATTLTSVNNIFQTTSVVTTITQPGTTIVTTVNQAGSTVVTTITQATTLVTTLPGASTTVNQAGATTTVNQITTVQQNNTAGLAVGAVAIIIAIIAGIVAVLAMRRK